ncbi:transcription factor mef2A [Aplysia californica]|uniref:Transcription factor mef2A n=1 Tax=Aplysia californica TaxID=6500 RepID=A0ABM1VUU8_APLCA|nr:transcription factor mef2A [Aplysia californica]
MPRSHVSVARFYDWSSDLGDCFSVSRLYREIANLPPATAGHSDKTATAHVSNNSAITAQSLQVTICRPPANNPGRMFVRDKRALTRGEKEIIQGIYRNRGDIAGRDATSKAEFRVLNHAEAWQAGKPLGDGGPGGYSSSLRSLLNGERSEKTDGRYLRIGADNDSEVHGGVSPETRTQHTDSPTRKSTPSSHPTNVHDGAGNSQPVLHKPTPTLTFGRTKIADSGGREVTKMLPAGLPYTHETSRRKFRVQNREDFWEIRPAAPPSTPDHGDHRVSPFINSGSNPVLSSSHSSHNRFSRQKTRLPVSSELETERLPFSPNGDSFHHNEPIQSNKTPSYLLPNHAQNGEGHGFPRNEYLTADEVQYSRNNLDNNVPPTADVLLCELRGTSAAAAFQNDNEHEGDIPDTNHNNSTTNNNNNNNIVNHDDINNNDENTDDSCSNSSNSERKRVRVKVYLPIAGVEQLEESGRVTPAAVNTKLTPILTPDTTTPSAPAPTTLPNNKTTTVLTSVLPSAPTSTTVVRSERLSTSPTLTHKVTPSVISISERKEGEGGFFH